MRKLKAFSLCLLALVAVSILPSLAHGESQEQATLEGVLRIHPKYLYIYYIECLGTGQLCALRKSEDLEKITTGSRIRVIGQLGTFYHAGSTKDNPSPFPSAWVMYMDVEKVTILRQAKGDWADTQAQLIKPTIPLHFLPRLSLKRNKEDPNTGNRTRSKKSEVDGFFTALLLAKDGDCVGFDVSREKVVIFNSEGDGWVLRDSEQARHHSRTEVHRVMEILDRPDFFNARPEAKRITFEEYKNIKAEFVSNNPRWKPKYAMTYKDEQGKNFWLTLESFSEDKVWLAHLIQWKTKGWDWIVRYELARSPEVEQEFKIPQILEQRSRIIGGVHYGMAVSDVIANKGEPKEIVHHAEGGSAYLIY